MALNVNDILQVRLVTYFSNQVGINVRHYLVQAKTGIGRTESQLADGLDGAIAPLYKACLAAGARWRGVGVKKIFPVPVIEFASTSRDAPGILAGDVLPPQSAGIIGLQTVVPGPKGNGRIYVSFPTESVNDATGLPTAAYQGLIALLGASISNDFTQTVGADSITLRPHLYHRIGGTSTEIIANGFYVRSRWGTQRRRGGFGAANQLPF